MNLPNFLNQLSFFCTQEFFDFDNTVCVCVCVVLIYSSSSNFIAIADSCIIRRWIFSLIFFLFFFLAEATRKLNILKNQEVVQLKMEHGSTKKEQKTHPRGVYLSFNSENKW